jgi:hypothetical protein
LAGPPQPRTPKGFFAPSAPINSELKHSLIFIFSIMIHRVNMY